MCNTTVHRPFAASGVVDPFSFSTFHLLRTCNRLMLPADLRQYYSLIKDNHSFDFVTENSSGKPPPPPIFQHSDMQSPEITSIFPSNCTKEMLPSITSTCSPVDFDYPPEYPHSRLSNVNYSQLLNRRQRGEKRPIPDEQKDEKYYERRKRNNEAAKKSRDARKLREDRIAFRAAILEQENTILRAQVVALREEITTIRQMMNSRSGPGPSINV